METDLTAFTWPQACPGQSCLTWVSCYGVGGGGGGGAGPDALGHPYSSGGIKIMPSLSKCLRSAGYHDVPLLHVHGHPGDVQSPSEGVTALLHVRTPRRKTCLRARDTSCGGGPLSSALVLEASGHRETGSDSGKGREGPGSAWEAEQDELQDWTCCLQRPRARAAATRGGRGLLCAARTPHLLPTQRPQSRA